MIICSAILAVLVIGWGVIHGLRWYNVNQIENAYLDSCKAANNCKPGNWYDQQFVNGPFSDPQLGLALKFYYDNDCDDACK